MAKRAVPIGNDKEKPDRKKNKGNSDDPDFKPKKKKHRCLSCCLAAFIVWLVLSSAAFGVGWYFGDQFTQQQLGIPFGDVFGMLTNLYWADEKKIVTNPYNDDDLNGFYSQIKSNILLKDDVEIDFEAAIRKAVESMGEQQSANSTKRNADGEPDEPSDEPGGDTGEPSDEPGDTGGGSNELIDMLVNIAAEVFVKENIDVERLKEYSPENDTYIFELRDKQLAAFANSVFRIMLESGKVDALNGLNEFADIKRVVSLKQIRFKAVSDTNESGENVITATTADVTVWLGLQDTAGQAVGNILNDAGVGWLSPLTGFILNVFLPKNVYATVTVPLQGDVPAQISLNSMNESERARAYRVINGFLGMNGGEQTLDDVLADVVEQIKPTLDQAAELVDFSSAAQGAVKLDLIDLLAQKASNEELTLHKSDFMYLLQALLTSDPDARLTELRPYAYDKWYKDSAGNLEYDPSDKTGKTLVDYEKEFIAEVEKKYALDFDDSATLDDVFAMLGIDLGGEGGSGEVQQVTDLIDPKAFRDMFDKPTEQLKLRITDRMLGSVLGGRIKSLMGDALGDLDIKLDALTFKRAASGHTHALVAAELDISGMLGELGDNELLGKLAANILPERIVLSVEVDIQEGLDPDEYDQTSFVFNDYTDTDRVLDTLSTLVPSLDVSTISDTLATTLRDMINKISDKVGMTLVPSVTNGENVTSAYLELPDVLTIITETVLVDDDGNPLVTGKQLQAVLRGLDETDGVLGANGELPDGYEAFIADVIDKYYLNASASEIKDFDALTSFIADGDGGFDTGKFRTSGATGMLYDARSAAELAPVMSAKELGALIKANIGDGLQMQDLDFELKDVRIVESDGAIDLAIVAGINVSGLLPDGMKGFIENEYMYATVSVKDINNPKDGTYPITVRINNMDAASYDNLLKIVRHFGGDFDIESKMSDFGSILYDQISALENSVGKGFFEFTKEGLKLESFYSFLASKLGLEGRPETIKAALQGLYERDADLPENPYNFVASDFVLNASGAVDFDASKIGTTERVESTDVDFNGYFQVALKKNNLDNAATAVQTIVLAKGADTEKSERVREWVNGKLVTPVVTPDKDFVLITFRIDVDTANSDDAVDGFLPDCLYATVVLEKVRENEIDKLVEVGLIFNDIDGETTEVLLSMMNMNEGEEGEDKVDVHSAIASCLEAINGDGTLAKPGLTMLCDMSFVAQAEDDEGIGSFVFTRKKIDIPVIPGVDSGDIPDVPGVDLGDPTAIDKVAYICA